MEIDYSPYLFVAEDGEIWWSVETAIKLAAGFVPVTNERSEQGIGLRARSSSSRAEERSILASLNKPLPTVEPPSMVECDGERFLRARDFLPWLNAYGRAAQSAFSVPAQLIMAVQETLANSPKSDKLPFQSLVAALDGWFQEDLDKLPAEKRQRIEHNLIPTLWDGLDASQRRTAAEQWDGQHDPATEAERERGFNAFCQLQALENQIREWELVAAPTALDKMAKEERLGKLRSELHDVQKALSAPREPVPAGWREQLFNRQTAGIRPGDPKPEFIPYPKAMKALRERLGATPEELAVWVWMTPHEGSLPAYLNANELDNPPRFFYGAAIDNEFDYVSPLMRCWFIADDVHRFQPVDRYVTGQQLLERWGKYPGIRVEAFVRAKIEESQLVDIHPTFGATQWTHPGDESYPPAAIALFVRVHVEQLERDELGEPPAGPAVQDEQAGQVPSGALISPKDETAEGRRARISEEHADLVKQGVKNPTAVLAKQEGIHESRIRALKREAVPGDVATPKFPFPSIKPSKPR